MVSCAATATACRWREERRRWVAWAQQRRQGGRVIYDVDIVAVPEQAVVCLRRRGPLREIGARMRRLRELAEEAGLTPAGPMMARFYDSDVARPDLDYDVCLPVRPAGVRPACSTSSRRRRMRAPISRSGPRRRRQTTACSGTATMSTS